MELLSLVYAESRLAGLESNAGSYSWTKHHLGASHVVVHHVFEFWLACVFVYEVEVYLLICRDLNSNIALDEINFSTHIWKFMIQLPKTCLFAYFEKQNGA